MLTPSGVEPEFELLVLFCCNATGVVRRVEADQGWGDEAEGGWGEAEEGWDDESQELFGGHCGGSIWNLVELGKIEKNHFFHL